MCLVSYNDCGLCLIPGLSYIDQIKWNPTNVINIKPGSILLSVNY